MVVLINIYRVLKDLSNGAEDEIQIFLHRYLSMIEKVLKSFGKCQSLTLVFRVYICVYSSHQLTLVFAVHRLSDWPHKPSLRHRRRYDLQFQSTLTHCPLGNFNQISDK